jgi:hypothetical protein
VYRQVIRVSEPQFKEIQMRVQSHVWVIPLAQN